MLHGHCHGNLAYTGGKIIDVGVDVFKYRPICIDEVKEIMDRLQIAECDHHTAGDSTD